MKKTLYSYFIVYFLIFSFELPLYAQQRIESEQAAFTVYEMAQGLEHPWGLAFLPNGDLLVTERTGQLRLIRNGILDPHPISGLPEFFVSGQGGLLDVVIHPEFQKNRFVYISYASGTRRNAGTRVARGRLLGHQLQDVEVIFEVTPRTPGSLHYGSRLTFANDGTLFITVGDRYSRMDDAQDPSNHLGSIMRVNDDGSVPDDNPFRFSKIVRPEIYSYGHRNVQGLTMRPSDQSMWAHEHGPKGGDEVNKLERGRNYGWPVITYGVDYSGDIISDKTHQEGMEQPIVYWDPSIAPSGMSFYNGDRFPGWNGDLFVGALAKRHLRRLEMDGDRVVSQEILLQDWGRIRDVQSGPDGFLYLLVDSGNGKILRLEP